MQAFRNGTWDGRIRLYNRRTKLIYKGLTGYVEAFCGDRGYDFNGRPDGEVPISLVEVEEFLRSLNLPAKYTDLRDYQVEAIAHCIRRARCMLLSPTASGKSFIIYALIRWFNLRTLILFPTTSLVHQMYGDFAEYSANDPTWNVNQKCSKIMGGYEKHNLNQVTLTTWQSVHNMDKSWFDYDLVIMDEAHGGKAKSLVSIMEKLTECVYRLGFTGTLDDIQVHKLVLEGLFGPVHKVIDTRTLIDNKVLANINIRCLLLQYSKDTRKALAKDYEEEIKFLISNERRNKFIVNLALSLKKNTLILYQRVEGHGEVLYAMLKKKAPDAKIYFVSGDVDSEERDEIRKLVDASEEKCIIVASVGTFAVGTNIVNLFNVIFASPSKAKIRTLQAIGRGLRKSGGKHSFTLFDIADDLAKSKSNKNYTLEHFAARLKIYAEEKFDFRINTIQIEEEKSLKP
jgi:superfamily II DNA or RNA helicase